jgi:hypothetical protein
MDGNPTQRTQGTGALGAGKQFKAIIMHFELGYCEISCGRKPGERQTTDKTQEQVV